MPDQPRLSVAGAVRRWSVERGSSSVQAKEASLQGSNTKMTAEPQFLRKSSPGAPG